MIQRMIAAGAILECVREVAKHLGIYMFVAKVPSGFQVYAWVVVPLSLTASCIYFRLPLKSHNTDSAPKAVLQLFDATGRSGKQSLMQASPFGLKPFFSGTTPTSHDTRCHQ